MAWGTEIDVRVIRGSGPADISEEKVAAYVAKYVTKHAESLGLPAGRIEDDADLSGLDVAEHVGTLVWTALRLGVRGDMAGLRLRDNAHGLGFGGHFLSKSVAYSTTYKELRGARRRRARADELGDGDGLDAWGRPENEGLVAIEAEWSYRGWGYQSDGEAWLAACC